MISVPIVAASEMIATDSVFRAGALSLVSKTWMVKILEELRGMLAFVFLAVIFML